MKKITILSILSWATLCLAWSPPADKLPSIPGALAFPGMLQIATGGGGGGGGVSTITYITSNGQNNDASGTSLAAPNTFNVVAGDLLVCGFGTVGSTQGDIDSISISCGVDALTGSQDFFSSGDTYGYKIFYKENASANASATCTATSNNNPYRSIACAQYRGVATSNSLDQTSCVDAGCTTMPSATVNRTAQNVTTSVDNELLLAIGIDWNGASHEAANGYTVRHDGATAFIIDKLTNTSGTHPNGNFSTADSDQYISIFATFKAAQ